MIDGKATLTDKACLTVPNHDSEILRNGQDGIRGGSLKKRNCRENSQNEKALPEIIVTLCHGNTQMAV